MKQSAQLTIELLKQQAKQSKNLLHSPLGFDLALSVLLKGCTGATKEALLKLHEGRDEQRMEQILDILAQTNLEQTDFLIKIAILYNQQKLSITPIIHLKEDYSHFVDVAYIPCTDPTVDFEISHSFSFEEDWLDSFENLELPNFFYPSPNQPIATKFIRQFLDSEQNQISYYSDEYCAAIQIPLKSKEFVFEVYLPHADYSLQQLIHHLSLEQLNTIASNFQRPKYIEVILPAFQVAADVSIDEHNSSLGLSQIYTPSFDYNPLFASREPLYIKKIIQQNELRVNKTGLKGKSKTIIRGGIGSISTIGKHLYFEADRPFLYLLKHQSSGLYLFIGTFETPTSAATLPENQEENRQIQQAKLIRQFTPILYNLTIRARVYLGLACLNILVREQQLSIPWAKHLIDDLLIYIEQDQAMGVKVEKLSFSAYKMTGFYIENDYFSLEEMVLLIQNFPQITELLGSICDLVSHSTSSTQEFWDTPYWGIKPLIDILEQLNTALLPIPDFTPYSSYLTEQDKKAGALISVDRALIAHLPYSV